MPWERELQSLEASISALNTAYDSFLYGSTARPPTERRKALDQVLRRLSSMELETAADRYRFSTLQGRYNALCERWDKLQIEKESGKRPGIHGAFARDSRRVARASAPMRSAPNVRAGSSVGTEGGPDEDAVLFERYLAARRSRGEDVDYDFPHFQESLRRERDKLRERLGEVDVEFDVAERDGRVKLVARRKAGPPAAAGNEGKA